MQSKENNPFENTSRIQDTIEDKPIITREVDIETKEPVLSEKEESLKPTNLGILKQSESRGTKIYYLVFKDLTYEIPIKNKPNKVILNNISGYFKSGEITAIMGPSGCGKTSTLNFLTNRIEFPRGSKHEAKLWINSEEITTNQLSEYSSYVMQDDLLIDVLTPVETLQFVAKLKKKTKEQNVEESVKEIIEILKLEKCKDIRIGNPQRKGISGGEKKRVSIGIEIVSNPSILFLDEPTSGLDSTTSGIIIEFLKELARIKNMIIVFTIHQPSSNIFQLFDRLLIMNKGEIVYQGPAQEMDSSGNVLSGIVPYFDKELGIPLQVLANPCDAFMHIIEEQNAGFDGLHVIENPDLQGKKALTELYKEKQQEQVTNEIEEIFSKNEKLMLPKKNSQNVSFCTEFGILLKRSWVVYTRNPLTMAIKFIMTLVYIFICLSIFWNLDEDFQGFHDRAGFIFYYSINHFLGIIFAAVLVFPMERPIFLREYASKLYGVTSYYLAKNLVETPLVLIVNFIYSLIIYYLVDLREGGTYFGEFLLLFLVLDFMSHSMGYFFGTTFSDLNKATIITQFTVIPIFLFSGFLINVQNMPVWLSWLQYFSPFRFSVEAGFKIEFSGLKNPPVDILEEYHLNLGKWNCLLCMFCWGVFYRTMGGILLKLLVKRTG
jgi:ABC-type multidrug transport system ATPase subunit